ncbi:MAG: hypothetical protein A2V67_20055 [Deltaproteobacteria bacterium RBG_13_61_14]|nr:MAG: hypothetical protein A2V67_20055 [Deltaproteobacteria bacterium RBG_13_61_14]
MNQLFVHLAVEGLLDEEVLTKAIQESGRPYQVLGCHGKKGKNYLKDKIQSFNQSAKHQCWIVQMDLNQEEKCAPKLVEKLLPQRHPNLILRVAVRELESWLLADQVNLSRFLGVSKNVIPLQPDDIPDPKQALINLVRHHSLRRDIIDALVPVPDTSSRVGKDYNGKLAEFVVKHWDVRSARRKSPSLEKAMRAFSNFHPVGLSAREEKEGT